MSPIRLPSCSPFAGPKMMVASPGFTYYDNTKTLPKIASEVSSVKRFVIMDDIERKYVLREALARSVKYEEYIQNAGSSALPQVSLSPHDMVNVQFTSGNEHLYQGLLNRSLTPAAGSTGLPKSVALSHYNIMNCGRYIWQQTRMTDQDRICLPVPLFHSFGMIVGT